MVLGLAGLVAVNAHPERRHANTNTELGKRGVDLSSYTMPDLSSYSKSNSIKESDFALASGDYVETATALVKEVVPGVEFRVVDDHYVSTNGIAHINFRQTVHGLDIDNADFHVNVSNSHSHLPRLSTYRFIDQGWQGLLLWKQLLHWKTSQGVSPQQARFC